MKYHLSWISVLLITIAATLSVDYLLNYKIESWAVTIRGLTIARESKENHYDFLCKKTTYERESVLLYCNANDVRLSKNLDLMEKIDESIRASFDVNPLASVKNNDPQIMLVSHVWGSLLPLELREYRLEGIVLVDVGKGVDETNLITYKNIGMLFINEKCTTMLALGGEIYWEGKYGINFINQEHIKMSEKRPEKQ